MERASAEQFAELEKLADRCAQAMDDRDVLALIDALEGFYNKLFEGAGNQTAAMLAHTLHSKESLVRAITFQRQTDADTKQSMTHIRQIASAIRNGNADAAAAACLNLPWHC